jgi:UDP-N-acetyl-D-galactosamine dehydrogenase
MPCLQTIFGSKGEREMLEFERLIERQEKIAVVGLGYVGLPLAVCLAAHFEVVGYDLKAERVRELQTGLDRTLEVDADRLKSAAMTLTHDPRIISECRLLIVAVPTPIDHYRIPDLTPLEDASATVGAHMSRGSCVVFESTVYPGATEEICIPILEKASGLKYGRDFSVGYSPERINPGDRIHTLDKITKVISGSDEATADLLARVYGTIVSAGIHRASSIKVAEAAKVIENTQRDLNIALMNELAKIFDIMKIDTLEVLEAAGTKWNFLPFRPGLVGGHCIGVDPYYLTFKSEAVGYHPEIILAGRRINDGMGKYIAERAVKLLIRRANRVRGARVAVLGITFKEDVPDLRNTKVVDVVSELRDFGIQVLVSDPLADVAEARTYYGLDLVPFEEINGVDAVILAVGHRFYREEGLESIGGLCAEDSRLVLDVKGCFDPRAAEKRNILYWRL